MANRKKRKNSKCSPENKGTESKRMAVKKGATGVTTNSISSGASGTRPDTGLQGVQHDDRSQMSQNTSQFQTPVPSYQGQGQGQGNDNIQYTSPIQYSTQTYQYAQNTPCPGYPATVMPGTPSMSQSTRGDQFAFRMSRFDTIERSLTRLDTIQSSVDKMASRLDSLGSDVTSLKTRVSDLENSRSYDVKTVDDIAKKQKEIDSLLSSLRSLDEKQRQNERQPREDIVDLKSRSMRDNLLFFGVPEEKSETDEACCSKVLDLIETQLGMEGAWRDIKLHRAHRIGRYDTTKTRPIVAKFAFYQARESVRRNANKLSAPYGISQQTPREVMDKRRQPIPVMLDARKQGKEAYIKVDKIYIDGQLYRGPPRTPETQ